MKFHTEYLWFETANHREYINITPKVEEAMRKSGIREGMILVSAMHITAGVWVNDAEDGLLQDIEEWLEKLAPFREDYRHHDTGESNGDSHLKSLLGTPPGDRSRNRGRIGSGSMAVGLLCRVRRAAA